MTWAVRDQARQLNTPPLLGEGLEAVEAEKLMGISLEESAG